MPIFSSSRAHFTPLRAPSVPSASGMNFGTMNSEMPLVPDGASGRRASTRCTMFSARSCSPDEMKILVPVIRQLPSACGSAFVRSRPRSVPQCGSVRHIVPVHSPETNFGMYSAFCSGVPCACRQSYAPCVRPGYIAQAWLPEFIISWNAMPTATGRPCPPYSGSQVSVGQPPALNCSHACLKPFGVVTTPPSDQRQPSSSPGRFNGNSTSAQNLPPSSTTWSISSRLVSAYRGNVLSVPSTSSSSCVTNWMSRRGGVYRAMTATPDSGRGSGMKGSGSGSGLYRPNVRAFVRRGGAHRPAIRIDQAIEAAASAADRVRAVQQASVVMQHQDDAVHLEHQFLHVEVGGQVVRVDGLLDRARQLALPRPDHRHEFLSHGTRPVVVFGGARDPDAAARGLDGGPFEPAAEDRAQARQPALLLPRRNEHLVDEPPLVRLEHRDLQVLARTEVREHAALGHLHALGERPDRQALEAVAGRQLERRLDDGRARLLALAQCARGSPAGGARRVAARAG